MKTDKELADDVRKHAADFNAVISKARTDMYDNEKLLEAAVNAAKSAGIRVEGYDQSGGRPVCARLDYAEVSMSIFRTSEL